jgi:4-hydroxy-tetrahydrodipicolinate synthase
MLSGETQKAAALQKQLMPLIHALFMEVNPIPVKAGLAMMGKLDDRLRLPLVSMGESNRAVLKAEMSKLGLLP